MGYKIVRIVKNEFYRTVNILLDSLFNPEKYSDLNRLKMAEEAPENKGKKGKIGATFFKVESN